MCFILLSINNYNNGILFIFLDFYFSLISLILSYFLCAFVIYSFIYIAINLEFILN